MTKSTQNLNKQYNEFMNDESIYSLQVAVNDATVSTENAESIKKDAMDEFHRLQSKLNNTTTLEEEIEAARLHAIDMVRSAHRAKINLSDAIYKLDVSIDDVDIENIKQQQQQE